MVKKGLSNAETPLRQPPHYAAHLYSNQASRLMGIQPRLELTTPGFGARRCNHKAAVNPLSSRTSELTKRGLGHTYIHVQVRQRAAVDRSDLGDL